MSNGIVINGTDIVVTLRHLSINGAGTGLIGVNVVEAQHVNIEDCDIFGFGAGNWTRRIRVLRYHHEPSHFEYENPQQPHRRRVLQIWKRDDRRELIGGKWQDGLQVDGTVGATVVMISNSTVALNGTGVHANAGGIARMTHLDIFGNTTAAWNVNGGTIETHVDNRIRGTGIGTLTPVVYP